MGNLVYSDDLAISDEVTLEPLIQRKVLLVDQSPHLQSFIETHLKREQYSVVCRDNGEAAIQSSGDESFDLILIDQNLPGLSGSATVQMLRDRNVRTPAILFASEHDGDELYPDLFIDSIAKPMDIADLLRKIKVHTDHLPPC